MTKRTRKTGAVLKIDLHDGRFAYARDLGDHCVAIYNIITTIDLPIEQVISSPILFTSKIYPSHLRRWEKLEMIPLKPGEIPVPYFHSCLIDKQRDEYHVYNQQVQWVRSATFKEIQGLEAYHPWFGFDIEQRIRAHFDHKTYWLVENLRPRPPGSFHVNLSERPLKPGTVKKIHLGEGYFIYGRELSNAFVAIYDSRTQIDLPLTEIIASPVLFIVSVTFSTLEGWEDIAFIPLTQGEFTLPRGYVWVVYESIKKSPKLHIAFPDRLFTYYPATPNDVKGLEVGGMRWENYHVENRIRDHYAGRTWDLIFN
jgi:hypothetical protein